MATAQNTPPVLPPARDLPPGTEIGGYEITHKLGQGGMGQVYAAMHPVIGKRVAIKMLSPRHSAVPDLVQRFIEEARAVNTIGHPNIIDIFSFGQLPDGRQFMVMEYLEGETLADRLQRARVDTSDIRRWYKQICEALEAAHVAGFVHRDLKPANIWITSKPHGETSIKLLDFGVAKLLAAGARRLTQTGATIGTPSFMSPEQCLGKEVDQRADIYSFGVILYLTFAGLMPFRGRTLADMVHGHTLETPDAPSRYRPMPAALETLILECLAKDPAKRPANARVLAIRLEAALTAPGASHIIAGDLGAPLSVPTHHIGAHSMPSTPPIARAAPPRSRARARPSAAGPLWLAAFGVMALAGGVFLVRDVQVRPDDLAATARAADAAVQGVIRNKAAPLEAKVAEAAADRLGKALDTGQDDFDTFQDLFMNEETWAPYRVAPYVSALVTTKKVLARTTPELGELVGNDVVERARAGKPVSGLIAGRGRAFAAAAALATGNEKPRDDAPVVVLAVPFDHETLGTVAAAVRGAAALSDGTRLGPIAGPREALEAVTLFAGKGIAPGHALLVDEDWAAMGAALGGKLVLLTAFPAPEPRGPTAAGWGLALGGGALTIIGIALVFRSRRNLPHSVSETS